MRCSGLVAAAVTLLGAIGSACSGPPERTGLATVVEVVDGDTVDVLVAGRAERVRLIGIDTPETEHPGTPAECHGPEASAFTADLLPAGSQVRIERDVVGRDHFGRLLGYVHLVASGPQAAGEVFVNLEIVERGHAVPLTIEPNRRHTSEFAAAATRAEAADLGLWASCNQIASPR